MNEPLYPTHDRDGWQGGARHLTFSHGSILIGQVIIVGRVTRAMLEALLCCRDD
jgi:hypothetical protein